MAITKPSDKAMTKPCLRCERGTREKDAFWWTTEEEAASGIPANFCVCLDCASQIVNDWVMETMT